MQLAGINPYRHIPAAEELAPLRDEAVYSFINRAGYAHTDVFAGGADSFCASCTVMPGVFGMKLLVAAFDAIAIGALFLLLRVAGRDPAELLIYAWMPLPVWEFVGNAHIDGVAASILAVAPARPSPRAFSVDRCAACGGDADEAAARRGDPGVLAAVELADCRSPSLSHCSCSICPIHR